MKGQLVLAYQGDVVAFSTWRRINDYLDEEQTEGISSFRKVKKRSGIITSHEHAIRTRFSMRVVDVGMPTKQFGEQTSACRYPSAELLFDDMQDMNPSYRWICYGPLRSNLAVRRQVVQSYQSSRRLRKELCKERMPQWCQAQCGGARVGDDMLYHVQ